MASLTCDYFLYLVQEAFIDGVVNKFLLYWRAGNKGKNCNRADAVLNLDMCDLKEKSTHCQSVSLEAGFTFLK